MSVLIHLVHISSIFLSKTVKILVFLEIKKLEKLNK